MKKSIIDIFIIIYVLLVLANMEEILMQIYYYIFIIINKYSCSCAYKKAEEMGNELFYVVFVGRRPGVYTSWLECQAQVIGFKGNIYNL